MDNSKSSVLGWVAIVIALIACIAAFAVGGGTVPSQNAGENGTRYPHGLTTGYSATAPGGVAPTDGKLTIGVSGLPIANLSQGTCYLQPYATTIAASSTATVDCQGFAAVGSTAPAAASTSALTGVTLGDNILASFATSTSASTTAPGLVILGASASTTAGYITLRVYNLTGAVYSYINNQGVGAIASGTVNYLDWR